MNDQDKQHLRDLTAMFALNGLLKEAVNGDWNDQAIAELAYSLADAMIEARNKETESIGLPPIKSRKTKAK